MTRYSFRATTSRRYLITVTEQSEEEVHGDFSSPSAPQTLNDYWIITLENENNIGRIVNESQSIIGYNKEEVYGQFLLLIFPVNTGK